MRISSRCIIFKNNKVLLIYREKNNDKYYVFPGGGIEEDETKEECIIRECKEEIGININVRKYVYKVFGRGIKQYFFLCDWASGDIGTGNKDEYDPNRKGGLQVPVLIDINELKDLKVISKPIVKQLLRDIEKYGYELDNHLKEITE